MDSFQRKLKGVPKAPPPPLEMFRPNDEQLEESIAFAKKHDTGGEDTLLFPTRSIIAILVELQELRGKKLLLAEVPNSWK